jgi:hypothetical protein
MNRSLSVASVVLAVSLSAFASPSHAGTIFFYQGVPEGIWVVSGGSGTISFCANQKDASSGLPRGRCVRIGSTDLYGTTYTIWPNATGITLIDGWQRAVRQCTVTVSTTTATGGCKVLGNIEELR